MATQEQLEKIGGKYWEMGDKKRVYFNGLADLAGLKVGYYNTGNVSSASLDGEKISNSQARRYLAAINNAKLYYDLADNKFHLKGDLPEGWFSDIMTALREKLAKV